MRFLSDRPYRVGFLLVDGFSLMSYSSAIEPLRAANEFSQKTLYDIQHVALKGEGAISSSGAFIRASCQMDGVEKFDLVVIVAGGNPMNFIEGRAFLWLQALSEGSVILAGVSGGPVILAKAGVMEGYRMTVHWDHAISLEETVPGLSLERALYIIDRNRITCAGGIAALDMMHALIARQRGPMLARQISDWFLHGHIRESSDPQQTELAQRYGVSHPVILRAIEAMERQRPEEPLTLSYLSELTHRSERHLGRLFQNHLGQGVMSFYRHLRLEKAHRLLMQTFLPITEIALATGFASPAHFADCFRKRYGETPSISRHNQGGSCVT